MALITYSSFVDRISGRIDTEGTTYTFNRGQAVIRAQPKPANPDSPDQVASRTIFSNLTKGWKTLTEAERNSWSAYAAANRVVNRLGREVSRSGLTAYLEINYRPLAWGGTASVTPPTTVAPLPILGFNAIYLNVDSGLEIDMFHGDLPTGGRFEVRITAPLASPAINPQPSLYRLAAGVAPESFPLIAPSPGQVTIDAADLKYALALGNRIGAEITVVTSQGVPSSSFARVWLLTEAP